MFQVIGYFAHEMMVARNAVPGRILELHSFAP